MKRIDHLVWTPCSIVTFLEKVGMENHAKRCAKMWRRTAAAPTAALDWDLADRELSADETRKRLRDCGGAGDECQSDWIQKELASASKQKEAASQRETNLAAYAAASAAHAAAVVDADHAEAQATMAELAARAAAQMAEAQRRTAAEKRARAEACARTKRQCGRVGGLAD